MDLSFLPKAIIKKITISDSEQINWNVLLSNTLLICIGGTLLSFNIRIVDKIPHICLIKELFGIPCPGCGILRSISELGHLHFLKSLQYNPVGIIILLSIFSQTIARFLLIIGRLSQDFVNKQTKIMNSTIITLLLTNWFINLVLTLKM
jgi:hypothetical protein